MGVIIPDDIWQSPHGITIEAPYVMLIKNINSEGIKIFESEWDDKVFIQAMANFYKDEEARRTGKTPLYKEIITCLIPYETLGNPFTPLYDELKLRYPNAVDIL